MSGSVHGSGGRTRGSSFAIGEGELSEMVKDTSLAANITVKEMFMATQKIMARTCEFLALYIEEGRIYLLFFMVRIRLRSVGEKKPDIHEGT